MNKLRAEWPTLLIFCIMYCVWIGLTYAHNSISTPILIVLLTLTVTLHSSLQHEVIHGHPTSVEWVNLALAFPALGWVVPYERFETLHLQHHRNELLTDPYFDSESYFLARSQWLRCSPLAKRLLMLHNTLLGRLAIGPAVMIIRLIRSELSELRVNPHIRRTWALHLLGLMPVLLWLLWVDFPLWLYFVGAVYPALSLLLLRAFSEHLPEPAVENRSAIIKSNKLMRLLYLNNNFHRVHHDHPELPWYRLPAKYRANYQTHTKHVYKGYFELLRHYAIKSRFPVEHPFLQREEP